MIKIYTLDHKDNSTEHTDLTSSKTHELIINHDWKIVEDPESMLPQINIYNEGTGQLTITKEEEKWNFVLFSDPPKSFLSFFKKSSLCLDLEDVTQDELKEVVTLFIEIDPKETYEKMQSWAKNKGKS